MYALKQVNAYKSPYQRQQGLWLQQIVAGVTLKRHLHAIWLASKQQHNAYRWDYNSSLFIVSTASHPSLVCRVLNIVLI